MKIFTDKGYIYQKHLSTGGEGEVHLIKSVDKQFVAKIFPQLGQPSVDVLETIQKLDISGIPRIHEIFSHEGKTIIIREYVKGTTLYDEIRKNEFLSLKRAKSVIFKICEILSKLHRTAPQPIIYRDLKPENIIITPDGDVKLIDFGIARYYKAESTRDTVLAGTKGYTAPEVMAGMQSDARSDVYSAGLLFYEMLTGKNLLLPPFQIRPVREANELLPDYLDTIIEKATDLNQTNRYKTIEELANAIEHPDIKKRRGKSVFKIMALSGAILIVVVGIWFIAWNIKVRIGTEKETWNLLLDIEFDSDEDKMWVVGYEEAERLSFEEGQLHVLKEGCNIDYMPRAGTIVHYKVIQPEFGSVGISQYRINAPVNFECIYHSEEENRDYSTNLVFFEGYAFKNTGQFVDEILYINEENSVIYAIAIDEQEDKICYASHKIPEFMKNFPLYLEVHNFTDGQESVIIDSIKIADGSLRQYLEDNFESYLAHREAVDGFLKRDYESISKMVLNPAD